MNRECCQDPPPENWILQIWGRKGAATSDGGCGSFGNVDEPVMEGSAVGIPDSSCPHVEVSSGKELNPQPKRKSPTLDAECRVERQRVPILIVFGMIKVKSHSRLERLKGHLFSRHISNGICRELICIMRTKTLAAALWKSNACGHNFFLLFFPMHIVLFDRDDGDELGMPTGVGLSKCMRLMGRRCRSRKYPSANVRGDPHHSGRLII